MENRPTIFVTNDDGVEAKGLHSLIEAVKHLGEIIVVAPEDAQSGMSQAITVKYPLWIRKIKTDDNVTIYACNGTPADCVKIGISQVLKKQPDMVVAGINHGSNSATSVLYSGTMGAALEGCINEIPSIGFSFLNYEADANFQTPIENARKIASAILKESLPLGTCLNVNIPDVPPHAIKGIRICRQSMGFWHKEFEQRTDPRGRNYYWMTGEFLNAEPEANDTDEWALENNYVSVVPIQIDMTAYQTLPGLKKIDFESAYKFQQT
ncbi:MAG: 5'/3'-nucleotidase SurE [Bacteroidetes bacterium]|nr:5'/3'-nucleotidase SurE [Bacteroidota bacterium]